MGKSILGCLILLASFCSSAAPTPTGCIDMDSGTIKTSQCGNVVTVISGYKTFVCQIDPSHAQPTCTLVDEYRYGKD